MNYSIIFTEISFSPETSNFGTNTVGLLLFHPSDLTIEYENFLKLFASFMHIL